jgi:selenide, water dikinase
VLLHLNQAKGTQILVGADHYDDAVVVTVNAYTTLVQTVDFFTPVVDDPYYYGRIAAANSLSDVYAMGGRPLTAMNIVCYPMKLLGPKILAEILRGGSDTIEQAGCMLAGGHTVEDPEPKYGLSVTGLVEPDQVTRKSGLKAGDRLILTKPIGSGIYTTAQKKGLLADNDLQEVIEVMMQLNDRSAKLMVELGCKAATDITGFSLLGHCFEMCRASKVTVRMNSNSVPLLPKAIDYREQGCFAGGSAANRVWLEHRNAVQWGQVSESLKDVLCDAQTSGGLLLALDDSRAKSYLESAHKSGQMAVLIGSVESGEPGLIIE